MNMSCKIRKATFILEHFARSPLINSILRCVTVSARANVKLCFVKRIEEKCCLY